MTQEWIGLGRSMSTLVLLGALLAGCASGVPGGPGSAASDVPASSQGASQSSTSSGEDKKAVAGNTTKFDGLEPYVTLEGKDKFGHYHTMVTKLTYALRGNALERVEYDEDDAPDVRAEGVFNNDVEGEGALQCSERGAAYNQATMWYPYTGLLVHGGSLTGVIQTGGAPRATVVMDQRSEVGELWVKRETTPFVFAGCVGPHAVQRGHRTRSGFVQAGDRLSVQVPGQRKPLQVRLPREPQVYAALEYANGLAALAPARIVLVTIDVPRKRLVLQYQVSFPVNTSLTSATLLETLTAEELADRGDRSPQAHESFKRANRAISTHLAQCMPATSPVNDVCLQPNAALTKHLTLLGD
ncbi:hypothetical protein [Ottowia thiooxydans]|uniref:Lipoprotein n=1 Tax=Ottowia thiooxydans TaxID=219182 RepID=A0ABV2QG55_9BURK